MFKMLRAVLIFACLLPGLSSMSDNIAYLTRTLRDMNRTSCDDKPVKIACPTGTVIYVQEAKYGTPEAEEACWDPAVVAGGEKCEWPNPMQYSLLQTTVEACQKKPMCQFSAKPMPRVDDPCPHTRKFVRVTYKCRPDYFRSRVACENEVLKLSCNPYSRLAVYDAEYGRTAFESECALKGVPEENCKASTAAATVMRICHGKRRCEVLAASSVFGSPCAATTRVYLKVVFACVPLEVLTEQYANELEADEIRHGVTVPGRAADTFDTPDSGDRLAESNTPKVNPALQNNLLEATTTRRPAPLQPTPRKDGEISRSMTYLYYFKIFGMYFISIFRP